MSIKRVIYEWTIMVSAGMAVTLSALWAVSKFVDSETYHHRITTSRSLGENLYFIVGEGDFTICDQIDVDASGNVRALVAAKALTRKDLLRGDQTAHFTIPGFSFDDYWNAPSAYLIWSVRLSLLIPAAMLLVVAIAFRRGLKRLQGEVQAVAGRDIDRTSQPSA